MMRREKIKQQSMSDDGCCFFKAWGISIDDANDSFSKEDYSSALRQYEYCLKQAIKNFERNACYDLIASITTIVVTQKNISTTYAIVGKYGVASAYYGATLAFVDHFIGRLDGSSETCDAVSLVKKKVLTEWSGFINRNEKHLSYPVKRYIEFSSYSISALRCKYYH